MEMTLQFGCPEVSQRWKSYYTNRIFLFENPYFFLGHRSMEFMTFDLYRWQIFSQNKAALYNFHIEAKWPLT